MKKVIIFLIFHTVLGFINLFIYALESRLSGEPAEKVYKIDENDKESQGLILFVFFCPIILLTVCFIAFICRTVKAGAIAVIETIVAHKNINSEDSKNEEK
jgi:hypothetical protein